MKTFTVKVLDCCEKSREAKEFLSTDFCNSKREEADEVCILPKVTIAILRGHEDFVSHDYVQQIVGEHWIRSDVTGDIITWNTLSYRKQLFHLFYCCLLLPFHLVFSIFLPILHCCKPGPGNSNNCFLSFLKSLCLHFTFPMNRFISGDFITHVIFIILVLLIQYNHQFDFANWDWVVVVICIGFVVQEIPSICKSVYLKIFHKDRLLIRDTYWTSINLCSVSFILISELFKLANKMMSNEHQDLMKYGYSFLGVGIALAILKIFYFVIPVRSLAITSMSIKLLIKV